MRKLTSVDGLEAIVGTRPLAVMMKSVDALDEGSQIVLAHAPVAGMGYRDAYGNPRTTVVGGQPGFASVESPTRISIALSGGEPDPVIGSGASLVFLLPGVGETLRVCGSVADRAGHVVTIDLREAWVHCAKCILRSRLWAEPRDDDRRRELPEAGAGDGPLTDPDVAGFVDATRFMFLSSWGVDDSSDTSPKGDDAGFVQILDGHTIAIPDRKGNRRTDTFHNLLENDEVGVAMLVPGRDDVLHMHGHAYVTDDGDLLATMALGDKPPKAALVVRVEQADITANQALAKSQLWDPLARAETSDIPDLMKIGAQHIAKSKAKGASATMLRALSKSLGASQRILRKGVDAGYRHDLEQEGYERQ